MIFASSGPQVEAEGAVQHSAHKRMVGIQDHLDEPIELLRLRAPRGQGVDQTPGQGGVGLTRDPLIDRATELGLDADRTGAGADQHELADPITVRRREHLRGDAAHRVADHAAALDAQRVEQRADRLRQSLRAREAPPVVARAERVQVD